MRFNLACSLRESSRYCAMRRERLCSHVQDRAGPCRKAERRQQRVVVTASATQAIAPMHQALQSVHMKTEPYVHVQPFGLTNIFFLLHAFKQQLKLPSSVLQILKTWERREKPVIVNRTLIRLLGDYIFCL